MTDLEQPLFRSVEGALKFAFADDYDAVARSLMSRMADGPSRTGRGLDGVNGFAQAGLILAEVARLPILQQDIITARFSPIKDECTCGSSCCCGYRHHPRWLSAIVRLTEYIAEELPETRSPRGLRDGVVRKYFGDKVRIAEIADYCRIHRNTASAHAGRIMDVLKADEKRVRSQISTQLDKAGLVGE